jgi:hypothetical protein
MAHAGKEYGLGFVGAFGLFLGDDKRLLGGCVFRRSRAAIPIDSGQSSERSNAGLVIFP